MTTVTTVSDTCNTNTRLGFLTVLTDHIVLMKGYRAGLVLAVVVSEPQSLELSCRLYKERTTLLILVTASVRSSEYQTALDFPGIN